MMLKKSLISILLIMCFLVGNLSTASAFEEDINVQNNGFADVGSAYEPDSFESESSVTDDNIIAEDETIVKIDENTQSELTSTVSGPGPYDITPGDVIVNIEEGETCQLTATNPYGILFTWSTTDPEIATVSAQGLVTAHKAGNVTVTASFFHNGGTFSARCTVYVYIDVGAFYVKNVSSGYYLNVQNGTINNYTNVQVRSKYPNSMDEKYRIQQIWRLHHLGNGRYSFRPFHKLDMALTVTGTNADIYTIGSYDTLSSVPSKAEWEIYWHMNGYTIINNGDNGKVLQTENGSTASGANVVVGSYSYSGTQRWFLDKINDPPKGVVMYDTQTGYCITSATKTIVLGETKTLSDLNLTVASYQPLTSGNQAGWSHFDPNNPDVATVNGSNGTVTANSCGMATITASAHNKTVSYTLWVIPIPEGTYFINNPEKGGYIQIDNDAAANFSQSGVHMEHHTLDGGDYQRWELDYLNNGYYKIISVESGLALSVPSGSENSSDVDLIQEAYGGYNRQQWEITPTSGGRYKIKARSAPSNLVICVNAGIANGTNIQQDDYLNNNSYLDEWVCIQMLPTNGYELEYDPEAWDGIPSANNNCYAYALNNQVEEPTGNVIWYMQQPGDYYNKYRGSNSAIPRGFQSPPSVIVNAVQHDFNMYNSVNGADVTFTPIGRYDVCPAGTYKIALVVSSGDYHWYRQDSDGLWSHKRGLTPIKRTDEAGDLIIDPMIADRAEYTTFVGFFAVKPWNNMYVSSRSSEIGNNNETANNNTATINDELLSRVKVGMTYEAVVEMLGYKGVDLGSGTIIQQYESDNGMLYTFNYTSIDNEFIVSKINIGGLYNDEKN